MWPDSNFINYPKDTRSLLEESPTLCSKTKQATGCAFTTFFQINNLTNIEAARLEKSQEYRGITHYGIVNTNEANRYPGAESSDQEFLRDRSTWELSQVSETPQGQLGHKDESTALLL